MAEDTIRDRVTRFLEPTSSDVRRAKRAMLAVLEDGRSHRTPALLEAAAAVLGAEPWIEKLELTFQAAPSTDAISVDDPVLMYIRSRLAGNRAIADLAVAGVIAPATDPENDEQRHDRIVTREEPITIGISHPSSSRESVCRLTGRRSPRRTCSPNRLRSSGGWIPISSSRS